MGKCDFCGKEVTLPFTCRYCGGSFCGEHRLPENHHCTGSYKKQNVFINGFVNTISTYQDEITRTPPVQNQLPHPSGKITKYIIILIIFLIILAVYLYTQNISP